MLRNRNACEEKKEVGKHEEQARKETAIINVKSCY
jgi:hypothetical protein